MAGKDRHGMITRSWDIVTYTVEVIDKTGLIYKFEREDILSGEKKDLRSWVRKTLYNEGKLLLTLTEKNRESAVFAQTPEVFLANATRIQ